MLRDGRLYLSSIAKLAPVLTEANREEVLARAVHRSKRQIEELVAEIAPKPDVPTVVRKLPERREKTPPTPGFDSIWTELSRRLLLLQKQGSPPSSNRFRRHGTRSHLRPVLSSTRCWEGSKA